MAYSRHDLIKSRLAYARSELDEVLGRVTQDLLDWAPGPGMRTVSGQLVEIIGTEMELVARMKEDRRVTQEEAREAIGDCGSLIDLRQAMTDVRSKTLDYLDSLSDAQLLEEVSGNGWLASLTLTIFPRAEIFVNIAGHEAYHTGQLTSYLWARGDDPYKW